MVPSLPELPEKLGSGRFLVIALMVGTTVFPGLFILRTTLVKEAGWTLKDLGKQRRDAAVSATLMFVISGAIMATAAGTLFVKGVGLSQTSQMITLLEPLAGALATSLFAVGIMAAGVSSQFPNVLMLPWLLCDFSDSRRDMTLLKCRAMVLAVSLLGLVVPLSHAPPVFVMIASQAFNALLLPATVACILYLGNRKQLMGDFRFGGATNLMLVAILAFSFVTTWIGLSALRGLIDRG
ncbi:NRAMP family divalent metal transporter [Pirellulimonas nuda]|nr:divalent metal cation transporter [Pirellulimonas nuda]